MTEQEALNKANEYQHLVRNVYKHNLTNFRYKITEVIPVKNQIDANKGFEVTVIAHRCNTTIPLNEELNSFLTNYSLW